MAEKHFHEQKKLTLDYLLPYLRARMADFDRCTVLEVGCAEAGFLDVLHERGQRAVGLELEGSRIDIAKRMNPALEIHEGDITAPDTAARLGERFDLIVLRDIIEHVTERDAMFANLVDLLKPGGYLYVTFPPRYSAFAGHQQNGVSFLRYIPFLHLVPAVLLRPLGILMREKADLIETVLHNYRTGLSIRAFEKLCGRHAFTPVVRDLFLFRPVYAIRFGLKTRRMADIPLMREFFTLGCEVLLRHRS